MWEQLLSRGGAMIAVRPAAVAGMFYPDDPRQLAHVVDDYIRHGKVLDLPAACPKAIVVPHAGYVYSGAIAGSAFATLAPWAKRIERVVVVGPAHRVWVEGLVSPGARAMATPLGELPIDVEALASVPQVHADVAAHAEEHSVEVELPFIQRVLPHARVVPIVAGEADPEEVGRVLEALYGGPETLIVISSDLSHYLPYDSACAIDEETIKRLLTLEPEAIDHDRACGATGLRGLLWLARRKHLEPQLLDLRNSGDTAGDRRRVVGYAALGFYERGIA